MYSRVPVYIAEVVKLDFGGVFLGVRAYIFRKMLSRECGFEFFKGTSSGLWGNGFGEKGFVNALVSTIRGSFHLVEGIGLQKYLH